MSHVHWWLVGLSFVMGVVLTSALVLRPAKASSPLEAPVGAAMAGVAEPPGPLPTTLQWPTAQVADAVELFSSTVQVAEESPSTEPAVVAEPMPRRVSGIEDLLVAKAPVAEEPEAPVVEAPVAEEPVVEEPVTAEFPVTRESPWTMRPVTPVPPREVPPAAAAPAPAPSPSRKPPSAKNASPVKAPAKKAPPAKAPPGKRPRPAKGAPAKRPKLPYAPYGPGSARATPEGGGPSGWLVKGRSDTRLFYTPDDPAYYLTVAQVWFKDEQAAVRAAFTPWRNSSRRK
ncbi:hypothetical protein [Mycobacterium helveticum]|uniref:channel accessory protein ArfC, sunset domain variant n=1 Tax=Mycobacterium helveticum TaxID=2592811 RepID=UPI003CCC4B16